MSRISTVLEQLSKQNKTALVPFVTAGDPNPGWTVGILKALVESGADIIELGVPFSDPMADGPVIQKASERALAHNVGLKDVLAMVKRFREDNSVTPIVLMGYLNPVEVMGYDVFCKAAAEAGVDGVLTVDMPPEESADLVAALNQSGLDPIYLISPTSHQERIAKITSVASGYLYYVSLKGVTGSNALDEQAVCNKIKEIRTHTDIPIAVGFGIKDAETAKKVSKCADAVIVGSALVNKVEQYSQDFGAITTEITTLMSSIRQALDNE
ncbi:MAG: tryptophan synthase subunit alpha [Methylococcales bacterium]|jgi:tryptophan synthase alpha chain|nr:tryptophan synthase subunit alpha [Methylococcales bacterium]MBT7444844.1 tryptophan synthase subunit alpha [Methylococcales bacterium]